MPTVTNANLTLTTVDKNTTIQVTYSANFSAFERRLAKLGLVFRERIRVIGVDPPGSTTGTVLANFPAVDLPVTDGGTPQTIPRTRSITVSRASLQEDSGLGDNDEIRCRIRIAALGLPPAETSDVFTDQELLVG
ncbi:hypothetical protein [Streptomyces sp. NPDC102476]|uniref:hypothetical protein n=1 Tax=Streptomyces sp. NPDC102476 TaxID=3366181 RepID=UPI00382FE97C